MRTGAEGALVSWVYRVLVVGGADHPNGMTRTDGRGHTLGFACSEQG
jgi:hypothetical protein